MAGRFTYSRWDGTQTGFDMETSDLFDELADDLLNNGDLRGALRRFMERGARDANGEKLQGLREMRQKLKQARQDLLDSGDPNGVFQEIADALGVSLTTVEGDWRMAKAWLAKELQA